MKRFIALFTALAMLRNADATGGLAAYDGTQALQMEEAYDSIKEEAVAGAKLSIRGDVVDIDEITFTLPDGRQFSYKR